MSRSLHAAPPALPASAADSDTVRELFSAMDIEREAHNRARAVSSAKDVFHRTLPDGAPAVVPAAVPLALRSQPVPIAEPSDAASPPHTAAGSSWKDVVIGAEQPPPHDTRVLDNDGVAASALKTATRKAALAADHGLPATRNGRDSPAGGRQRRGRRRGGGGVDRGLPRFIDQSTRGDFSCSACSVGLPDVSRVVNHVEGQSHIRMVVIMAGLEPETQDEGEFLSLAQAARLGLRPIERFCFLCDVHFSSAVDRNQHLSGKKHANAARKYPQLAAATSGVCITAPLDSRQHDSESTPSPQLRRSAPTNRTQHRTSTTAAKTSMAEMQCTLCNTHATSQADIVRHYSSGRHRTMVAKLEERGTLGSRGLYCGACGLICESLPQLFAHFEAGVALVAPDDHQKIRPKLEKDRRWLCPPCGMSFVMSDLEKHLRSQSHEDGLQGKLPAEAGWGQNAGRRGSDRRGSHGGSELRSRGGRGSGVTDLNAPVRTVLQDKFVCAVCNGQVFASQAEYSGHTNSASHRRRLSSHGTKKTTQPTPTIYTSALACGRCDMAFTGEPQLQEHMRTAAHLKKPDSAGLEPSAARQNSIWDSTTLGGSEPLAAVPGHPAPVGHARPLVDSWGTLGGAEPSMTGEFSAPLPAAVAAPRHSNGFATSMGQNDQDYSSLQTAFRHRDEVRHAGQSVTRALGRAQHFNAAVPTATGAPSSDDMFALFERMLQQSEEREKVMALKLAEMERQINQRK